MLTSKCSSREYLAIYVFLEEYSFFFRLYLKYPKKIKEKIFKHGQFTTIF